MTTTNRNDDRVRRSSGQSAPRRSSEEMEMRRTSSNGKSKMSKKAQRKKRRRIILIVEILVLLLLLLVAFAWLKLGLINHDVDFDADDVAVNDLDEASLEALKGYKNIALFGVDNRTMGNYDTGNSDTIIICSINQDTKDVTLTSVYRDTLLDVGDGKITKCNYAYNHGGPEQAISMLNRNLDLNIKDYVSVDFKALVDVVNDLDGLEMTITDEEAMYMNQAYIPYIEESLKMKSGSTPAVSGGTQTLNGVQVLAYCRVRYTAGDDYHRASRQREVIGLIVDKAKKANPIQLNNIINDVFPEISTSLSTTEVLGYAKDLTNYNLASQGGFPYDKYADTFGDLGSCVAPCTLESNVAKFYEQTFGEAGHQASDTVSSISNQVVNLTGCTEASALDYGY
ncbi:MAG: LCP family protein [Lachnospiraceae bacterium]|nr:LCP family protein [Lachnospiraceae bacterium]